MRFVSALTLLGCCTLFASPSAAKAVLDDNVCNLATFLPFQDLRDGAPTVHADEAFAYGYGTWPDASSLLQATRGQMAAAELAVMHFNDRNPVLVPELEALTEGCDVQLQSTYTDTAYDRVTASRNLLRHLEDITAPPVCTVMGQVNDQVAQGLSVLTEALHVPQISHQAYGWRLSNKQEYPMFARVIPEAYDFGAAVTMFFQRDIWHRETAGIIYDETDFGEQFESPLEDLEEDYEYLTITESFTQGGDDEGIAEALLDAKDKGFRTMVIITDQIAMVDDVARVADSLDMLGPGYFYILNGISPALLPSLQYPVDSPADRMLRGAALFTNYDRFVYYGEEDPFMKVWKQQGASLVNKINSLQPQDDDGKLFMEDASADYFQRQAPPEYASFMYDAVMTAGISACAAAKNDSDHYGKVLETQFTGASGPIKFAEGEDKNGEFEFRNSRDASEVVFGMYNVRPGSVSEDGMQSYDTVLTHLYTQDNTFVNSDGEVEHGAWAAVPDTEFLFFDGTTNEPMPRRETADSHYISHSVHVLGLFLSSLAIAVALCTGMWVFYHRNAAIVKSSQPEFLYLLCGGSVLVAFSAILISFDEDKGVEDEQLDVMCSAFPWFFVIGYLTMYCALMSKLWRISKIMQMRRRGVNVRQVILPFCVIIACCLLVLTLLQTVSPFQWERAVISEGEEPLETYGHCGNIEKGLLPFVVPLGVLMVLAVATTAGLSWKLRDVQHELAESRWIFVAIYLHLQTWAVGEPILYITNTVSRDAEYLMMVALAFTFATSPVALVVWPKMYSIYANKFSLDQGRRPTQINFGKGCGTRVSGLNFPSPTTTNSARTLTSASPSTPVASKVSSVSLKNGSMEADLDDETPEQAPMESQEP